MKKNLFVFMLMISVFSFSQCNIVGKNSIKVLEEETYSVSSELAQCKECHLWISIGGNANIQSDNKLNFIKLKSHSGGRQILSAAVLTPQGLVQCSKNIDILDNSENSNSSLSSALTNQVSNCDVKINNYKEVKYAENVVSFFPNEANNEYKYEWSATYSNGDTMKSNEKIPQFPFSKENGITSVKLKISSKMCLREFSKTYDSNYWKFF